MTFHLRSGPRFYAPGLGHEPWSDDLDRAFRFDDRADAEHVREALMLVDASLAVAVVPDCPKARQQDEVRAQHRSSLERMAELMERVDG